MVVNKARFKIDAHPAEDLTTGDRGVDVVAGQTIALTLELNPARALSVQFQLPDSNDPDSPYTSLNTTQQVFNENAQSSITSSSVNSTFHITINPATAISSYVIRCIVVDDVKTHIFERMIAVRQNGVRMTVPAERIEYEAQGWSNALNEMALHVLSLPGTGDVTGPGSSISGNLPSFGSGSGKLLGDSKLPVADLGQIKPFGLALDGVTNDYTLLQAAITARAGKVLDLGGYTIKCNSPLTIPNGITIRNGTIDFSGCADNALCMSASGSLGTVYPLTANLTYGAKQFQVASTSGLATGDWLLIESLKVWAASGGGVVGEVARVKSVDSATLVTLETPARSSYNTADSAKVTKLVHSVANVTFRDVKFIGNGIGHGQRLFQASYSRDIVVEGCESTGFENTHWDFWCVVRARVDNVKAREATLAATAYGVVIQRGSRDVSVTNSFFSYMRHGVAVGGSAWVNRYIRIANNHAEYMTDAGFDSHPMCQYITFKGNTVICKDETDASNTDGLTCQAADFVIEGNIVVRPYGAGIYVQNLTSGCETAIGGVINGNEVIEPGGVGIYVLNQGQTMRGVAVNNNKVSGAGRIAGSTASIQFYALTGAIMHWACNNNAISDAQAIGIQIRGASNVDGNANCYDGSCSGNAVHLSGTANNADGILLLVAKRAAVCNNEVFITETDRFGINVSSGVDCIVSHNIITLPSGTSAYCIQLTGTGSGCIISGNRCMNGVYGLAIGASMTACTIGLNDWTSCTTPFSAGTGTGHKLVQPNEISDDKGNADFTVQFYSEQTILFNTPLTAAHAVTEPAANVRRRTRIVRGAGATGAFNLNVGTLAGTIKALTAAGQWCEIEPNQAGTAHILVASGSL